LPEMVKHPNIDRAQYGITSLIKINMLPLSHATSYIYHLAPFKKTKKT